MLICVRHYKYDPGKMIDPDMIERFEQIAIALKKLTQKVKNQEPILSSDLRELEELTKHYQTSELKVNLIAQIPALIAICVCLGFAIACPTLAVSLIFVGLAVLAGLIWGGIGAGCASSTIDSNPVNRFFNQIPRKPRNVIDLPIEKATASLVGQ